MTYSNKYYYSILLKYVLNTNRSEPSEAFLASTRIAHSTNGIYSTVPQPLKFDTCVV